MGRITTIIVFAFLYFQCISCDELWKHKRTYAYKGKILMKNVASDKLASIWTISGKLSVEDLTDHITFKLDDVRTRIYNGNPSALDSAQEKLIPEDSNIIQAPFVVHPGNKAGYNITHKPDEPIWSLNMKRSIANIFFLNTDRKTNSIANETTIYGECEVKYKVSNDGHLTILKTINRKNCEHDPSYDASNVAWDPTAKDFEPITSETKRIYHFDDPENLFKVESFSFTTYQSMPGVRSKQIIEQSQEFTQISNTTSFEPTNIADLSETSSIIFDYSKGAEGGRGTEVQKKTPSELIEYYNTNYDEFKKYFESCPLQNINKDSNDTISLMYSALESMNKDTLMQLGKNIFDKDDNLLQHIFVSYLPYLGTNDSLNYIKDLLYEDEVLNDLLIIKILATLPIYINDITEETIEKMEYLMDLNKFANIQVRYAGILSFASIVSHANNKDVLSMNELTKYIRIYYKKFKDADDYETKMTWLLGLINMGNGIQNDYMIPVITDSEESRHIRVLAIYGFKERLTSEPNDVYNNMWPIVKNSTEPFEVRVACLDLLLYSQISEEQFKSIVNWYHDELLEPSEQHLANYMYTTLKALQNTTGYYEYLGDYATETLQQIKPLKINKAWSTGNYRMAYTDSDANFGASFQARLISNPVTHVLNSAFFTVDSFAHSLNLGRYSAYIKAEGVANILYSYINVNYNEEDAVPKLLELLKKNAYKLKEVEMDDVHIDLVLFSQDRVIFSMHINKDNIYDYMTNTLYTEFLSLLIDYNFVSFPVFDYNYLVSDLGTGITISTDITEVASYELKGLKEIFSTSTYSLLNEGEQIECTSGYRSIWYYSLYTECYNPLIETSIATFKYIGDEKRIHIPYVPYGINYTSFLLEWKHEKDAINAVSDHLIGTMVDNEKVLHEYCADCEQISLVPTGEWITKEVKYPKSISPIFGTVFNWTYSENSDEQMALNRIEPIRTGYLHDLMDHHQEITFDNMAKPFLLFCHYVTYNKFIDNDLYRYSLRSMPYYEEPTEAILKLHLNITDYPNYEHPIRKKDVVVSIFLTTRKQHDAKELSHGNVTFKYMSASESNSSEIQPHIHNTYNLELNMDSDIVKIPIKICVNRDVSYPSRKPNKFSLDPVDDTITNTTIAYGNVENKTQACPTKNQFFIAEVYSANENQKAIMEASNEYKNCKELSRGLKYIPPTDDCFAAHEMISKYRTYDLYAGDIPRPNDSIPKTEYGVHLMRYSQLNDTHVKVSIILEDLFERFMDEAYALHKAIEQEDSLPLMTVNPRVIAYDDNQLEWGIENACYITSKRIRTFTGHTIKKYYDKSGDESVAFVECSNATAKGMTIQKYGDKYVGFHLWSYNDTLVVSVPDDGKIKIEFNGEVITTTNKTLHFNNFKIYFLDDDVILFTNIFMRIFYTKEYVSVQTYSIYNDYICGLCAETQHN